MFLRTKHLTGLVIVMLLNITSGLMAAQPAQVKPVEKEQKQSFFSRMWRKKDKKQTATQAPKEVKAAGKMNGKAGESKAKPATHAKKAKDAHKKGAAKKAKPVKQAKAKKSAKKNHDDKSKHVKKNKARASARA